MTGSSKLLSSVFNALLPNPIFRKVMPSDYKLFQAADFICSMELVRLKLESNQFSKSEMTFFGSQRYLKQNYLNILKKKSGNESYITVNNSCLFLLPPV